MILSTQYSPSCPLDRFHFPTPQKAVEHFPTNLVLVQLIDERAKGDHGTCIDHQEAKIFVCLTDKCKACKSCVDFGKHKGHQIIHTNELRENIDTRKKKLQLAVDDFDIHQKKINSLFDCEKKNMAITAREEVRKIRELIDTKECEILLEIDSIFAIGKAEMENKLEKSCAVREEAARDITHLNDMVMNEKFFGALTNEVLLSEAKTEYEKVLEVTLKLKESFESSLKALNTSAIFSLERVKNSIELCETKKTFTHDEWLEDQKNPVVANLKQTLQFTEQDDCLNIIPIAKNSLNKIETVQLSGSLARKTNEIRLELSNPEFSAESIQALQYIWRSFEHVIKLKINMSGPAIGDSRLNSLCLPTSFWAHEGINSFAINLKSTQVSDEGVSQLLNEAINKMKDLQSINLNLQGTKITDKSVGALTSQAPMTFTRLEKFHLTLDNTAVTDDSLIQLHLNMKMFAPNLNELGFSLGKTQISDRSIASLTQSVIPTLTKLEVFELNLSDTKIHDASIKQLFVTLRPIAINLKHLRLNLTSTKITDSSIQSFSLLIPVMKKLEIFYLQLGGTDVTDEGLKHLFLNMNNNMKHLKIFVLHLESTNLSDASIEAFSRTSLGTMTALESFELYLSENIVSNTSIVPLCMTMGNMMRNVKRFVLGLHRTGVTDLSIQALSKFAFPRMKALESFELNLSDTRVSDASMEQFCMTITNAKETLASFVLDLNYTEVTNRVGKALTNYTLPALRGLKKCEIRLDNTRVSVSMKNEVLKKVPS